MKRFLGVDVSTFSGHFFVLSMATSLALAMQAVDAEAAPVFRLMVGILWVLSGTSFIGIGLHELGHWLVAKLLGWKIVGLRIWPLSWRPSDNSTATNVELKFRLLLGAKEGGFVLAVPKDVEHFTDQYWIYILGGPLASLIVAVSAIGISRLIVTPYNFVLLIVPWLLVIVSLIPTTKTQYGAGSDGWWLLQALRHSPHYEAAARVALISNLIREGIRFEDLDEALFDGLDEIEVPISNRIVALSLVGSRQWRLGQWTEALETWRRIPPILPGAGLIMEPLPSLIRLDLAMAEFAVGKPENGTECLEKATDLGRFTSLRLRVEAIASFREGNTDAAIARSQDFGTGLRQLEDIKPSVRDAMFDTLEKLDRRLGEAARRAYSMEILVLTKD